MVSLIQPTTWLWLGAALLLMAGLMLYVTRLNHSLRLSKRVLETEIAERRRAEERLAENERHLRQIIASEPECVKLQSLDGILLEMNPAGLALLEASRPEDIIGTSVYNRVAPEFRVAYRKLTEKVFAGESGVMEFQIISLKGHRRWMETHAVPLRDGKDRVAALLGITRDITARKHAEDEIRLHYRELSHAARVNTMGEMASGLAHELNQPLAAIANYSRGCLHRIRAGNGSVDDLVQAVEKIHHQADRAGDIISSLRRFVHKEDAPQYVLDVHECLREAMLIAGPEIKQRQVTASLHLTPAMPRVLGHGIQIEQVLLNLVRNAVEAMEDMPAPKRFLDLYTRITEGTAVVEVHDTGPGLPKEILQRIFEPFFTTKPTGMGMGLPICRSIIEAHGGTLVALPKEGGRGLIFRFSLPLHQESLTHE